MMFDIACIVICGYCAMHSLREKEYGMTLVATLICMLNIGLAYYSIT